MTELTPDSVETIIHEAIYPMYKDNPTRQDPLSVVIRLAKALLTAWEDNDILRAEAEAIKLEYERYRDAAKAASVDDEVLDVFNYPGIR